MAIDFFDPKEIQALYNAEDKEISAFVSKLKNKIERFLNKISSEIGQAGADIDLNELSRVLSKISAYNLPPDIANQLNEISSLYQSRIDTLEQAFKQVANAQKIFATDDANTIQQILSLDTAQVVTTIEQTFNEFKQATFRGVVSKQLPDLPQLVQGITDSLESRLPSDLNTQLAAFQRSVSLQKGEQLGLDYFLYAGGLIKTSRPFCQERAGKIFSVAEAKTWDNGQGLPVIPYLGGWNCRHTMVFMDLEKAKANGYRN